MFENAAPIFQKIQNGDLLFVKTYFQDAKLKGEQLKYVQYFNCEFYDLLSVATIANHLPIVQYLIEEQGFLPEAEDNIAMRLSLKKGHVQMVQELLRHEKVVKKVKDNFNYYMDLACGQSTVIKLLKNMYPDLAISLET